ncbi:MAG: UDP-N-acetylmuramoyl-L-alanine--D-glutamate ligase [Bacillota bacterium]|nr:UDP-N-acetylmuramoyl-L-alanine--D-glutamate ligase [Bacillota bacterium]
MDNKKILIVGLGKSGIAMLKVFSELGNIVDVYDGKDEEKIVDIGLIEKLADKTFFNHIPEEFDYDLIAVSPGVPLDIEIINKAKEKGIKILGEIELAYLLSNGDFIGITGTNGKTTTTSLVYEIFKTYFENVELVGNIGIPAIEKVVQSDKSKYFIAELSSFQLETIEKFKVEIGAILNITPDHLNRHKTMENYIQTKLRIFENIDKNGFMVLNYDDEILKSYGDKYQKAFFFSRKTVLEKGCYIKNGNIFVTKEQNEIDVMKVSDIYIPGSHNVENVLAAVSIAFLADIPAEIIRDVIKNFRGVEHRLEIFEEKFGRVFINDSKATNPDATMKAIESMCRPTVLIAGGMDKGSDFTEMIQKFGENIKYMVLYGETKNIIADIAVENGFESMTIVNNLNEAVKISMEVSNEGYNILLSPACASWDMYPDFEVRGRHFKEIVEKL